jgi:hypothetical protein
MLVDDKAPFGYFPGTGIPRKKPEPQHEGRGVCKRCGKTGLVWEQQKQGWLLVDIGGKLHQCEVRVQ